MVLKLFCIRDSKGEFYDRIFQQHTIGEAERTFYSLANDPKTQIGQYPEDYDLYYLGDFDNITGTITAMSSPQHILKAINIPKKPAQQTSSPLSSL